MATQRKISGKIEEKDGKAAKAISAGFDVLCLAQNKFKKKR